MLIFFLPLTTFLLEQILKITPRIERVKAFTYKSNILAAQSSLMLCSFQIPHLEPVKETPGIQPLEEKEPLSADGHLNDAPYDEEPEEAEEEEEELEGPGSETEAPLEDISGEPAESGTCFTVALISKLPKLIKI